jgi:hypothetical protein
MPDLRRIKTPSSLDLLNGILKVEMATIENFTLTSNMTQLRKPHIRKLTKMFSIFAGKDPSLDFSKNPESVKSKVRTANFAICTEL